MGDIFDTIAKQDIFDTVGKQDVFDRVGVLDPDQPIGFVEDIIPPVDIPGIADPRDVTITPVEAPVVPSGQQFFRQAPEPTSWQNFKRFFTGDRPPLPPNAERMEKFDRVFDIAIGQPLRVFLKFSKGKTLNLPDLVWAGLKKITPDSMWTEEVKKMNLDQAMDWAAGHDPSGFELMIGDLAEFMGRLGTAKKIGQATGILGTKATLPKDMTKLIRAGEAAKLFGLAATAEQFSKLAAETIDPQTDYQYEGAMGVLKDMGIGAGLSLAVSTIAEPALAKTAQSAIGKKIIESANRAMIEFSKRFPQLADAFRKNPRQEFVKMTEDAMKARGMKPTEFTPVQKAYVRNVAREFERRYIIAFRNYKTPPDIVTRGPGRRGLQITARTARDTQAIEFVRNALREEKFAALDEKTRAEIGQRMLAEQGVEVELSELAETPPTEAIAAPDVAPTARTPAEAVGVPQKPAEITEPVDALSEWIRLNREIDGTLKEMQKVSGQARETLRDKLRSMQAERKALDIGHKIRKMTPEEIAEDEEFQVIAQDILDAGPDKVNAVLDTLERRIGLLTKVSEGILTQEEADTLTAKFVAAAKARIPEPQRKQVPSREVPPKVTPIQKRTVSEIQSEIDSLLRERKSLPTELLVEFNAAVKEAKLKPKAEPKAVEMPEGVKKGDIFKEGGQTWKVIGLGQAAGGDTGILAETERGQRVIFDPEFIQQKLAQPPTEAKRPKAEPITGRVITVEKAGDVGTKIPRAPKEPVTENPTIPLKGKEAQVFREEVRTQEKITEAEEGEVGIEPAGASLTDHIETFHTYQLPLTSKIPPIVKQMKRVNGLRLAGKLTPQEANNKIYNLRKDVVAAAIKEKIAIRVSKKGKVKIALRQSGIFVPEEFATYKKYKDIEPILGGGQDITRAIQQMDGALSIKEKLKVKGQAGPIERFVLWRTRKMSLQKLNWLKEKTIEIRGILSAKKGSIKDKEINIILEQIGAADRDLPIKDVLDKKTLASMSKESIKAAQELRQFYDDMIEEQNAARLMRGQSEIPYRLKYAPNILRDTTVWEQLFLRGQTAKIMEKRDLPDYIKPNAPFNPRAQAREAKIPYDKRVLSARELAESYIITASKDIFNTSIIQNNKAFIDQLKGQGLEKSAEYLAEWTATSYAGIKPRLDRAIKLPKWAAGSLRYFNRLRNLAVFPINVAWSLSTQPLSLSNTIGRYGLPNTVRGFFQWLKPSIRKQAAQDYYSFIVKTTKRGGVTKQDASNLLGENIKTQKTVGEFVENFTTILLTEMEKLLTGTSIRAAYITGAKRGLKGEALKQFASDGGGKTQSMYNDEDKPMILRSLLVKSGAPYQTYAFEVANTFREWAGKTGTPPDTKLYALWSVTRWLAALIVLKMMANTVRGRKWSWWDLIPIPFREFWLTPIIRKLTGEFVPGSAGLPAPVETATRVAKGINDVLEEGNWRKLRNEMLKYGPGVFRIPGGVQWARMVDAIIVYSSGGLTDRKGKVMFEMKDPEDLARAMFTGVWTTEAGQEKLEPKETKKPRKFKFGKR